jgi:phytoene dehydrogenase-like protein
VTSFAVVIGAGANELVAAHYLARAGHRALVLTPTADDAPAGIGWVPEPIVRDLGLAERGLQIVRADPWAVAPLPGGGRLELWCDVARSAESIRALSPADAAKWPAFCERMARLARLLETVYLAPPPDPLASERRDLLQLAGLALRARGLGRQGIEDLLRTLPMPVADLLDDWFESDALKGVLGAAGVMHLAQGPRSAGTAFGLLHRHLGSPPGVFHPSRSNFRRALAGLPGIQIRPGAEVVRISVREGRATGVVLANGEEIAASVVVSGADPKRTLLELVDPGWLDPALVRAVRAIRARGVVARLTLALDRAPGFSTLVMAPSLDYLERAHDDAKYGRVSRSPWLEATSDGERVAVHVQYAPYDLAEGEWDEARSAALGDLVVRELAPHLGASIAERRLRSPVDLERDYGWPGGQAHQAEPGLDQLLWMRPIPALARYRTPIDGLYLCGTGVHPGGGVAGAPGANAARTVLRDRARLSAGR